MSQNIFFAWAPETEVFEPSKHARHDEEIFTLEIRQEEGRYAEAHLWVPKCSRSHNQDFLKKKAFISVQIKDEIKLIFVGRAQLFPHQIKDELEELKLVSQPFDSETQLREVISSSKKAPYWDPLFVSPFVGDDDKRYQDASTASFYCHRLTWSISRSDWFQGSQTINLRNKFVGQSLHMRLTHLPLGSCTVRLHAQWLQSDYGITDVSRKIMRAFPHRYVHSFTGNNLLDKWPQAGQVLGRSGYWLARSKLKPMGAIYPLGVQPLPKFSKPLLLKDAERRMRKYRLKRSAFQLKLWLGWHYQQKRYETLTLSLNHASQMTGGGEQATIDLYLNHSKNMPWVLPWQAEVDYAQGDSVSYYKGIYVARENHRSGLCFEHDQHLWQHQEWMSCYLSSSPDPSFFLTDRGYQAAEHGLEIAKQTLAKSARCFEIRFQGAWEDLLDITTDDTVSLEDPRLLDGKAMGKVVAYKIMAEGDTGRRWVEIILACAIGSPVPTASSTTIESSGIETDYCEAAYQQMANAVISTPSGLKYYRYDNQMQQRGVTNPKAMYTGDIIRKLEISNASDTQEQILSTLGETTVVNAERVLNQHRTDIRLYLRDIRSSDKFEHHIMLTAAEPWSAPQHIILS